MTNKLATVVPFPLPALGAFLKCSLLVACLGSLGSAQGQPTERNENGLPATKDELRARYAAREQVALGAEQIIEILRAEPALTLQVKKVLVERAYEEGRLLDDEELTDDVLHRLIRDDRNVRILATREIVDRNYIRLKPTREQLERARNEQAAQAKALREAEELRKPDDQMRSGETESLKARASSKDQEEFQEYDIPTSPARVPGGSFQGPMPIHPEEMPALLAIAERRDSGNASALVPGLSAAGVGQPRADFSSLGEKSKIYVNGDAEKPAASRASLSPGPSQRYRARGSNDLRSIEEEPAAVRRKPNPYANVPSLYDLYSQASTDGRKPHRFGSELFENGTGNIEDVPMDLPVGPDYVLGPGDGLKIEIWGGISERLQRVVDRQGRVALPEVGTLMVVGRTLGDVQREVRSVLRSQFRDIEAEISLARLRSVRVYVVGDVERPGPYDISALSTALNAVYTAGGPTSRGSLRTFKHYRGKQLVQLIDSYDLILRGINSDIKPFAAGDTVLVPPVGPQVTIEGMVRRPATYELADENNLAEVLELAGGILPSATLRRMQVERLVSHQGRTMLSIEVPEGNPETLTSKMMEFKVQDGDHVRVSPVLPHSEKTVYLDGHVFRPGKYSYAEGMKVSDLVQNYSELLPEPSRRHAEIIRLNPPDFRPAVISFNLADALAGEEANNLPLQPFDTVRVFSRFDFEDPPVVSVAGEVRNPGVHRTNGETRLRDAVYLAGGLTPDALEEDAQIFRRTGGNTLRVLTVNLADAMAGDQRANLLLLPNDRLVVHRNLAKLDPPAVFVKGEVGKPGKYPLSADMTASQLVRIAGGFKRSAYTDVADLSRYLSESGRTVHGENQEVMIAKAVGGDPAADVALKEGDVLTIRQIPGWNDIGASITVRGEVLHPSSYGIRENERLSSILKRAGGFRTDAYAQGAVLERVQVRELADKARQDLIRRIESEGTNLKFSAGSTGQDQAALMQAVMQQQNQVLGRLRSQPPTGRLVIRIDRDISKWENTSADIEVRAGDVITIPKKPNFVLVSGEVYNPTALTFSPGRKTSWYLQQAGGTTEMANKKSVFVIRANGSVVTDQGGGWWGKDVMDHRLQPGDTIVVPAKLVGGTSVWKNLLGTAQLVSSVAIAAGVATSF